PPSPARSLPVHVAPPTPAPSHVEVVPIARVVEPQRTPALQSEAREALSASHDANVMLVRLARVLVPGFADGCAAWLIDSSGAASCAASIALEGAPPPPSAPPRPEDASPRRLVLQLHGRV